MLLKEEDGKKATGIHCSNSDVLTTSDEWDIMWGDKEWMKEVFDTLHLGENQRVNHFRNHFEVLKSTTIH